MEGKSERVERDLERRKERNARGNRIDKLDFPWMSGRSWEGKEERKDSQSPKNHHALRYHSSQSLPSPNKPHTSTPRTSRSEPSFFVPQPRRRRREERARRWCTLGDIPVDLDQVPGVRRGLEGGRRRCGTERDNSTTREGKGREEKEEKIRIASVASREGKEKRGEAYLRPTSGDVIQSDEKTLSHIERVENLEISTAIREEGDSRETKGKLTAA